METFAWPRRAFWIEGLIGPFRARRHPLHAHTCSNGRAVSPVFPQPRTSRDPTGSHNLRRWFQPKRFGEAPIHPMAGSNLEPTLNPLEANGPLRATVPVGDAMRVDH